MRIGGLGRRSVGLVKSATLPIAVDFGTASLKLLQLHRGDQLALVSAAEAPTPENLLGDAEKRLAWQAEQLPRLLKKAAFKGRRAVCALPAGRTICKQMQVNKPDGVSLIDLIKAALPAQLGCHPEALVYRPIEVGQVAPGKTEVACLAAPHELVARLMQILRSAKLEPVGMHAEFIALAHAFDGAPLPVASGEQGQGEDDATILYLDIGAGSTKVVIGHGRKPAFARLIEIGGARMDRLISEQIDCTIADAHTARRGMTSLIPGAAPAEETDEGGMALLAAGIAKEGGRSNRAPAVRVKRPDLSEPLEILMDEISMCLRYHAGLHPQRKVDTAVFLGGEATHLPLCTHIARGLRLKAHTADPLARVGRTGKESLAGADLRRASPGWAVPLGLCLAPTDL